MIIEVQKQRQLVISGQAPGAQVFVFDRQATLCYRTGDSPGVSDLESLIARVAA